MSINPENKCALLWNKVTQEDIERSLGNQNIQITVQNMMNMQNSLQLHVAKAKPEAGNKAPSDCNLVEGSQFAMYYFGCAAAEFYELMERFDNYTLDENNPDYFETIYEYIDIWHFLMNVFLYSGVPTNYLFVGSNLFTPTQLKGLQHFNHLQSVSQIFNSIIKNEKISVNRALSVLVNNKWGELSANVGKLIGLLPFKRWKTYSSDITVDNRQLLEAANDVTVSFFQLGNILGITEQDFKRLYVSKNIENFDRQDRGY